MTRDLNDTLIFVKVVEHGSFIAAANSLRLPKTTVSRKVQELETRLGAQLLHRTTRKLGLTEAGNIYYEHCQRIARELTKPRARSASCRPARAAGCASPRPTRSASTWIAPLLGEFHARHPEVRVEMMLSNEPLDLIAARSTSRCASATCPTPTWSRAGWRCRTQVYASPATSSEHGEPLHPDDLQHHRTLAMRKHGATATAIFWTLGDGVRERRLPGQSGAGRQRSGRAQRRAAVRRRPDARRRRDGQAVRGTRPRAARAGRLDRPECEFNAVFPRGQVQSPKVRAFVDFLVES